MELKKEINGSSLIIHSTENSMQPQPPIQLEAGISGGLNGIKDIAIDIRRTPQYRVSMLDFQRITQDMKTLVDSYASKYGEHEGFLHTLRANLCNDIERVYLFSHGPRNDTSTLRRALQNIIDDAHSHNCRVKFQIQSQRRT